MKYESKLIRMNQRNIQHPIYCSIHDAFPEEATEMSQPKQRKEAEWKSRKQDQQPHGKIKSLKELSSEYGAEHTTS